MTTERVLPEPLDRPIRLVCLISGSGTTLQNLMDRSADGRLPADIRLVISSRPDVRGLDRARQGDIPTQTLLPGDHPSREKFSAVQSRVIDEAEPDLIVMAGYLYRWLIPQRYRHRVINIHPALLPSFGGKGYYGLHVHRAVLEAGVKVTGCTVHFCDDEYDHGPIIAQEPVRVRNEDTPKTLARRVQKAERRLLPKVIRQIRQARCRVEGRRVQILEAP